MGVVYPPSGGGGVELDFKKGCWRMKTPPRWLDVTPAEIDAVHERHRLTWADMEGPEAAVMHNLYNNCHTNHRLVETAMRMLEADEDPRTVLSSLLTSGYRLGWYVRDEEHAAEGISDLMSDTEMKVLRDQIARECPVRGEPQRLLAPVIPIVPSERIVE